MTKRISVFADVDILKSMFEEDFSIMKNTFLEDMLSDNEISELYDNDILSLEDETRINKIIESYKNNSLYTRERNRKGSYVFTHSATKIKLPITIRFNSIDKSVTFKLEFNYLFEKSN